MPVQIGVTSTMERLRAVTLRRTAARALAVMALSLLFSAGHVKGHVRPGQGKDVVAPPPGHTSVPPGQKKI
jgi:hypothetical protein